MLIMKENSEYSPDLPESDENARYVEIKDRQGINDDIHKAFQKSMLNKTLMTVLKLYRISLIVAMTLSHQNISPTEPLPTRKETRQKEKSCLTKFNMHSLRGRKAQAHQASMVSRGIGYEKSSLV